MSTDQGAAIDLSTMRGRDYPGIRQFSIFSPNKVGQLLTLIRLIESSNLNVCALAIVDSADCAIIRLVTTRPERAYELLKQQNVEFCEVDLIAVELPTVPHPILSICTALVPAEINIHYCFPMLVRPYGRPALAMHVEDPEIAIKVLEKHGFVTLTENDLEQNEIGEP